MKRIMLLIAILVFATIAFAETNKIVTPATTAAYNSAVFTVGQNQLATVTFTGTVGVGETADIQITPDNMVSWVDDSSQLTSTDLVRVIVGPGRFRVVKSATASAAGIVVTY